MHEVTVGCGPERLHGCKVCIHTWMFVSILKHQHQQPPTVTHLPPIVAILELTRGPRGPNNLHRHGRLALHWNEPDASHLPVLCHIQFGCSLPNHSDTYFEHTVLCIDHLPPLGV